MHVTKQGWVYLLFAPRNLCFHFFHALNPHTSISCMIPTNLPQPNHMIFW